MSDSTLNAFPNMLNPKEETVLFLKHLARRMTAGFSACDCCRMTASMGRPS